MTWDEANDDIGFNLAGLAAFVSGIIMALANGTLLKVFPHLNFEQMDINDVLAIILAVVGLIFTLLKSYHEVLKIIDKRQDMKQKKFLDEKFKRRSQLKTDDNTKNTGGEESSPEMGDPTD